MQWLSIRNRQSGIRKRADERFGYNISFLSLAAVGFIAFILLFAFFPETQIGTNPTILHEERLAINEAD